MRIAPAAIPDPAVHVQEWAVWVAAVSGGLVALAALIRQVRKWWQAARAEVLEWRRRFNALDSLVQHELRPNTGSSIKDALHRLEDKAANLQRVQEKHLADAARVAGQIEGRLGHLEDLQAVQAEAQLHVWPAIKAVAEARPPHDPSEPEWPEGADTTE